MIKLQPQEKCTSAFKAEHQRDHGQEHGDGNDNWFEARRSAFNSVVVLHDDNKEKRKVRFTVEG